MDACLRKMFNIDAVCGFVGFEPSGVQHRMSQMWRLLFTSRDAMDYDAARTHLDKLGGSVDATADVVGAAAYGHLGDIFRLGGHAVRMPYFTYSIFCYQIHLEARMEKSMCMSCCIRCSWQRVACANLLMLSFGAACWRCSQASWQQKASCTVCV